MPKTTHGMSGTRIYQIWKAMKQRCSLETNTSFKNYGGRGIRVCDEWFNDFSIFHAWAKANGYASHLTIDRYPDVNGNYEPSNCRWSTKADQTRNTRRNRFVTFRGRTLTVTEFAREHGLVQSTLSRRLDLNWDVERALTTASRKA